MRCETIKKADNTGSKVRKYRPMSRTFNYRHLYYFWVVGKEGGIARGAARLGMAVQTVSAQVRELERALGHALLKPAGRGLVLTEAGHAAMRQADQIFQLGEALPSALREIGSSPTVRLTVGVSDGLQKLVVWRLMQPVIHEKNLRVVLHVGGFEDLLADLALHRLDVVLADRAAPPNPNLKLYSHSLNISPIGWYAAPAQQAAARRGFPASLATVPVLLPTSHVELRARIDQWFVRESVLPKVVGEFEDSALLKTFGASGMGVFPAAEVVHDELVARYHVKRIGHAEGVYDHLYAVGTEKKVQHPLVQRLLAGHVKKSPETGPR